VTRATKPSRGETTVKITDIKFNKPKKKHVTKSGRTELPPEVPVGTLVDSLRKLEMKKDIYKARIKEVEVEIKVIDEEIVSLKGVMFTEFARSEIDGAIGKLARAEVKRELFPQATDWARFYEYVKKNDAFHLLHKRLSIDAYREVRDSGAIIPGLVDFVKMDIKVTPINK
jgi:hypothetical protein